MQELAHEVWLYLRANPILYAGIGLIAGFAGCKTVMLAWRSNVIFFLIIGLIGLFLSQLVLHVYGKEYLATLPQFRILFDLLAAYLGAFAIAALVHFVKPV